LATRIVTDWTGPTAPTDATGGAGDEGADDVLAQLASPDAPIAIAAAFAHSRFLVDTVAVHLNRCRSLAFTGW
jgi:hypothetical protein